MMPDTSTRNRLYTFLVNYVNTYRIDYITNIVIRELSKFKRLGDVYPGI